MQTSIAGSIAVCGFTAFMAKPTAEGTLAQIGRGAGGMQERPVPRNNDQPDRAKTLSSSLSDELQDQQKTRDEKLPSGDLVDPALSLNQAVFPSFKKEKEATHRSWWPKSPFKGTLQSPPSDSGLRTDTVTDWKDKKPDGSLSLLVFNEDNINQSGKHCIGKYTVQPAQLVSPERLPARKLKSGSVAKVYDPTQRNTLTAQSLGTRTGLILPPRALSTTTQDSNSIAASSRTSSLFLDSSSQQSVRGPLSPPKVEEDVLAMLSRTFPYLADRGMIEDVLASSKDPDKAFEQLQILQDEFTAADSQSPSMKTTEMTWDEKLAALAADFPEVPSGTLSSLLNDVNGDLTHAQTLLTTHEDQRLEDDRRLALDLDRELTAMEHAQEHDRAKSQATVSVSETDSPQLEMLCQHFPSTSKDVISQALKVCDGSFEMALEVLRGEGYEFVQDPEATLLARNVEDLEKDFANLQVSDVSAQHAHSPVKASKQPSTCSSPGAPFQSMGSGRTQSVYLEARRPILELQQQIDDLKHMRDDHFKAGRHLSGERLELKITELIRKKKSMESQTSGRIYREINKNSVVIRRMDLHGQHVSEALGVLHRVVSRAVEEENEDTEVTVVTGRGNGSIDNIPRVKLAVIKYLDHRGIPWQYEPGNLGALKFQVTHQKALKPYNQYQVLHGL